MEKDTNTSNSTGESKADADNIPRNSIKIQDKKTFILTMKNVGDILDLNTKEAYNKAVDSEGVFI